MFQNRRWDNDFLTVRQILADGLLGRVTRFEARYDRYRAEPRVGVWRESQRWRMPGDYSMIWVAISLIRLSSFLATPLQVYAEMERQRPGAQVDDDTFVALTCAQGVHAHLWMSVCCAKSRPSLSREWTAWHL